MEHISSRPTDVRICFCESLPSSNRRIRGKTSGRRHTAAKLRREAGESIETVSQFLDHSSLAVTSVYLRRLEGEQDRGWPAVARLITVGSSGAGRTTRSNEGT